MPVATARTFTFQVFDYSAACASDLSASIMSHLDNGTDVAVLDNTTNKINYYFNSSNTLRPSYSHGNTELTFDTSSLRGLKRDYGWSINPKTVSVSSPIMTKVQATGIKWL
jgi:hypothetical protein